MGKKVAVFRKEHFNAAHRLHHPDWDDARNFEVFGKCSYPHYHGHNYELVVKVTGEPNPQTGFVMDMKQLSDIIHTHVISRFDHRNLNLDLAEFRNLNPTAENIVVVIFDLLRPHIDPTHELSIRLYETERNFVEYGEGVGGM
ncbi:6-pyruvoyl tetrahydropterin synthase family protein [Flavihumibacter stibioxidans]|uniref:6-carboxy-5,6,7,8-tetrahydropterin synthase n=1 Tax=Flavihumibacter stibioxidans TaxID=1834163 RepID=A0ABR7MBW3_9BACT|nr:6-carboxytetrahydropterin synthase [Flavihumibacter stibioxidans]MBC6492537.1 6-pyruvoyl tetrahydrobiopterin synthase [Flavihumibacter stibioxidans]